MSVPVQLFIGWERIKLVSYAYIMHIYLCPLLDVTGNRLVWLVCTLPMGLILADRRCVGCSSCLNSGYGIFGSLYCVDILLFLVWSRCPLLLAMDLVRCLATTLTVRLGRSWKTPFGWPLYMSRAPDWMRWHVNIACVQLYWWFSTHFFIPGFSL